MKKSNSAERLHELCEILDISQSEVVKRTGIDKSTMSLYFSGQRVPRQDKISIIADAFNLDPAWIMGYDVPMKHAHLEKELEELVTELGKDAQLRKVTKYFMSLNQAQRDSVELILSGMLNK